MPECREAFSANSCLLIYISEWVGGWVMTRDGVIKELVGLLEEDASFVVMMCGVAGSGKTTFAQQLEQAGYVRLSIDEEIWSTNGRYGIDYSPDDYEQ